MAFKVLHCLLVFFRRSFCLERAEISSLTRFWIFLARIQPILARFQSPDHEPIEYSQTKRTPRVRKTISSRPGSSLPANGTNACVSPGAITSRRIFHLVAIFFVAGRIFSPARRDSRRVRVAWCGHAYPRSRIGSTSCTAQTERARSFHAVVGRPQCCRR